MKTVFFVAAAASAVAASADAGFLGFSAFSRVASNGNRVIDVVAVVSNANDRLLNVYNGTFTNNAGAGGSTFFTQQAGLATRGWKPDALTSNRSNSVDSFCTIGVEGGAPYYGEYYAASAVGADGSFTTGWSSLGNTFPANAGWFISPPTLPDNVAESLANFTGTRYDSNAASAGASFGVWVAHFVMSGTGPALNVTMTGSAKDGNTGATTTATGSLIPAPGAIALIGFAGFASRRRRA